MLQPGSNASMAFPLISRGQVVGSIHFSFIEKRPKSRSWAPYLAEFADGCRAVENMLAHTRLQEMNKSLGAEKHYLLERARLLQPRTPFSTLRPRWARSSARPS